MEMQIQGGTQDDGGTPANPDTFSQDVTSGSASGATDSNAANATGPGPSGGAEKTLVETGGGSDGAGEKPAVPQTWPDDWREQAAGGDDKVLKYLNRYASPANVVKAMMALRAKMDSGTVRQEKPDAADEKALAEWRQSAGIPDVPDGYLEKVPDGIVFGDADKPMLSAFLKDMHEADAPPEYVHKALSWYKRQEDDARAARAEADRNHRVEAEVKLREEFGAEYRGNLNGVRAMLETHGDPGVLDRLFAARMSDGTLLGDDPQFLRTMVALSREINPHGAIPTADSPAGRAMADEMASLRKDMADGNSDYWSGPKGPDGQTLKQRRYAELIAIDQKRVAGRR